MSSTYRIHGSRFLRKYTAAEKSSCYSYMSDVRKIANTLCTVPWERVTGEYAATMTIHTEEGLDWNAPERERFDAAEWCAEHEDGFHRAYAQAACYVFKLPTSAVGLSIEKISVNVTSDPYNPYGARISALTSNTLDIPMDCTTVRQGEVYRSPDNAGLGAAPRLYVENQDGTQTWYANSETVELVPASVLTAKQYLFVFVCLENYNRGRDGWIEGSSYIDNDVELTLSASVADFVSGEMNDCRDESARELPVVRNGILPYVPSGVPNGEAHVSVRSDANFIIEADGSQTEIRQADGAAAAAARGRLFARFYAGDFDRPTGSEAASAPGAAFNFMRTTEDHVGPGADSTSPTDVLRLDASVLAIPFVYPNEFVPSSVRFDFAALSLPEGARFNVFLTSGYLLSLTDDQLKNPGLYDGDDAPFTLIGKITGGTSANFVIPASSARVGTFVISGWYPPERCSLTSTGRQGTGITPFLPEVTLIA